MSEDPPTIAARSRPAIILFVIVAVVTLAADLLFKKYAFEHVAGYPIDVAALDPNLPGQIAPHDGILVIPKVLQLRLTLNRGAAFGLGQGGRWMFIVVAAVAVLLIAYVFYRSPSRAYVLHIALALLLAGAIGNVYDRIRFGMVRDMLLLFPDVPLPFGWKWPSGSDQVYPWIFNVADAAMCVALVLLLGVMLFEKKK